MYFNNHPLVGAAGQLPINEAKPVINYSPVVLPIPGRPVDLQLRVAIPATRPNDAATSPLPIILLSHGHGASHHLSSLEGYAPLVEFWASHGFAVLQPTHLSSATLKSSLPEQPPAGSTMWWQTRAEDMSAILDRLDFIEEQAGIPSLKRGSLDRERVAVAGHSFGAFTASMLLGLTNRNPATGELVQQRDPRIKAGVLLANLGVGGEDVLDGPMGGLIRSFYSPDFSTLITPALALYGDLDVTDYFTLQRGADWHEDVYRLSPGAKHLAVIKGGKHILGGISGWDVAEAGDDLNPERLEAVRRISWAYLRSQLYPEEGDKSWDEMAEAMKSVPELGYVAKK